MAHGGAEPQPARNKAERRNSALRGRTAPEPNANPAVQHRQICTRGMRSTAASRTAHCQRTIVSPCEAGVVPFRTTLEAQRHQVRDTIDRRRVWWIALYSARQLTARTTVNVPYTGSIMYNATRYHIRTAGGGRDRGTQVAHLPTASGNLPTASSRCPRRLGTGARSIGCRSPAIAASSALRIGDASV